MGKWNLKSGLKEPFCGASHLFGALLSMVALVCLIRLSLGNPLHLIGFILYGVSLITLYTASALYHSLRVAPRYVARLQRFDFIAIFLLIAGTYVPVCLITLKGAWGWSVLAAECTLAMAGITATLILKRRLPDNLRVAIYVVMGWLIVFAAVPMRQSLPAAGIGWLLGGGLLYSVGGIVLAVDKPHLWPGKFSAHDLWHVFVLGGAPAILC